jgi:hypothetical protein
MFDFLSALIDNNTLQSLHDLGYILLGSTWNLVKFTRPPFSKQSQEEKLKFCNDSLLYRKSANVYHKQLFWQLDNVHILFLIVLACPSSKTCTVILLEMAVQ